MACLARNEMLEELLKLQKKKRTIMVTTKIKVSTRTMKMIAKTNVMFSKAPKDQPVAIGKGRHAWRNQLLTIPTHEGFSSDR